VTTNAAHEIPIIISIRPSIFIDRTLFIW
jgi:hypothetical protein